MSCERQAMHVIIDARTVTPHFPGIGRYVSNLLDALPGLLQPGEGVTALYVLT